MADPVVVLDDTLTDIADAIRAKTGGTAGMTPSEMPAQIASIPSGGGGVGIPREVDANGVYGFPTQPFAFSLPSGATELAPRSVTSAFYGCTTLTAIDFSHITAINSEYCAQSICFNCTNLTSADFGSLATVAGNSAFSQAFYNCTNLTSADFGSLTTVTNSAVFYQAFYNCTNLTSADFGSLTTAPQYIFRQAFRNCRALSSASFPLVDTVGYGAFEEAFGGCTALTSLSFPALTPSSFGTQTNQFNSMLSGVVGCTVHFPAAIQSTIGNWASVQNGFGGTNTTVLFDL